MEDLFDFDAKFDKNLTKIWATKLVAELSTSFEKLALRLDKMDETFNKRFDDLEMNLRGDITQITKTAESAMELAKENKSEVDQLKLEMETLKQWCKQEVAGVKQEQCAIKTQTNSLESYSRRDNLIFHGINEPTNESSVTCEKLVRQFFVNQLQFSDASAAAVPFIRCHRIQSNTKNSKKPIIVRFKNFSDREIVWSKKSLISERTYSISEDFPKDVAYRRKKLFPVFAKARKTTSIDRKSVSLKSDVLIIRGKKYTVDTLNQLKGELDMKTFNERSNAKLLVFGGMYSNFHPLSNFYPCSVSFRNYRYTSTEQAYQHTKALLFGDLATASKIMSARDAADAKRISYDITGTKEHRQKWDNNRFDLMSEIVKAKFAQNSELFEELKSTGTRRLAESGKHVYYATGLSITHRDILNTDKWTGNSNLGDKYNLGNLI